jgi:hypothetical protein
MKRSNAHSEGKKEKKEEEVKLAIIGGLTLYIILSAVINWLIFRR